MDLSFLSGAMSLQGNSEIQSAEMKEDQSVALLKLLSGLNNGETLLSTVIGEKDGQVQLKLAEGIVINAKPEKNVMLSPGSNVFLQVQKRADNTIALRPLYQNNNQENTAEAALRAASLPLNERALELVARKMEYFNPIDRNSLIASYREINEHPEVPVKYIVDLQNMGIERTPENINQYKAYMNMENSVTEAFGVIEETMVSELADSFAGDAAGENSLKLTDSLIKFADNLSDTNSFFVSRDEVNELIDKMGLSGKEPVNLKALSQENLKAAEGNPKALSLIPNEENNDTTGLIKTDTYEPKDVLKALLTDLKEAALTGNTEKLRDLIKDESVTRLFNKTFSSQFYLNEENIDSKQEIKDLYRRIYDGTNNLINALNESGIENANLQAPVHNLSENVNFMNALNNFLPYVQIPFNGEAGRENGELYVFKNKKGLSDALGSLSAFIHLDMDNLGPTDVFVSLAGEKVTTNFRVSNDEVLDLIEANIGLLNKRLNERGYSFEMDIAVSEEKKTPIETVLDMEKGKVLLSNVTFDARV